MLGWRTVRGGKTQSKMCKVEVGIPRLPGIQLLLETMQKNWKWRVRGPQACDEVRDEGSQIPGHPDAAGSQG